MAVKPRVKVPKSAKVGDIVQIKTLISHKMETGNRKDKKTGKKIPRLIINSFVAKFNGKQVFKSSMHPSISSASVHVMNSRVNQYHVITGAFAEDMQTEEQWITTLAG